jgi:hypothetical protein
MSYVVIRPSADLPAGFLPDRLNGLWLEREFTDDGVNYARLAELGGAVAVATGRFEQRGDGAVAEVFEVRP